MTYSYTKHKITLQKSVKEASIQAFPSKKPKQVQRHSDDRRRNMKAAFWKVEKSKRNAVILIFQKNSLKLYSIYFKRFSFSYD